MKCWNCGTEIEEDSFFCSECGADQREHLKQPESREIPIGSGQESFEMGEEEAPPPGMECPVCGSPMASGEDVCPVCGHAMKKKKSKTSWVTGTVIAAVVLLGVGIGMGSFLLHQKEMKQRDVPSVSTGGTGTVQPGAAQTEQAQAAAAQTEQAQAAAAQTEQAQAAAAQTEQAQTAAAQTEQVQMAPPAETEDPAAAEQREERKLHTYKVVLEDCTWDEAFARCRSMGGYLVRFNTLEEFRYVTQMMDESGIEKKQLYIGMRRDLGGNSYYLTDEENQLTGTRMDGGYTAWTDEIWLNGEPSYRDAALGIDETCVSIFRYGEEKRWVMNDVPADLIAALESNRGKLGYICEMP